MQTPANITRKIQEVDSLYLAAHKYATDFPEDQFLRMSLEDLAYQKKELLVELEQSLISHNQHSLQYIFKTDHKSLEIKTITTNLSALGRLVDHTLGRATGGKQKHLPIYLNTIFSGSFGIQLTTPPENKLLDHDFEKAVGGTIDTLASLINTPDEQLSDLLKRTFAQDGALVNRFSALLKSMALTGQEVEIRWLSPVTSTVKSVAIAPGKAVQLLQFFEAHSLPEEEVYRSGVIKGVSLLHYVVEFVADLESGHHIKADFDVALTEPVVSALNRYVVARLLVKTTYSEARDEPRHTYRLLALEPTT